LFIGGILLLSATAAGQTPPADARVHFGPVGVTPSIEFTDIGFDSNVFHESEAERPQSDVTATIVPRVELGMDLRRARISSRIKLGYDYFKTYQSERSLNTEYFVRVDLLLNRIRPYIAHSFIDTRDREALGFQIDSRPRRVEQVSTAGTDWRLTGKLSVDVMAQRSRTDFDEGASFLQTPFSYVLDRDTTRVGATVRHASTPLTTLVLVTEGQQDRFDSLPERNADSVRITPGVEFSPSGLLSGRAYAGVRRLRSIGSSFSDVTGFVTWVDLNYTLLGASRFTVHAERDTTYSFRILVPYDLLGGVRVSFTQRVGGPWDLTGHVGRSRLTYGVMSAASGLPPQATSESAGPEFETWATYGAGIGFRTGARIRLGFGFEHDQRRSNVTADRQFHRSRVGTSFVFTL
jgi:hypothetical protein